MLRTCLLAALLGAAATVVGPSSPAVAADDDPPLSVPEAELDAALSCTPFTHPDREPVLLVHGTGVTPEENWGWNYAPWLPEQGWDVCTVRLPERSGGDIQVSSEYVVHAVRRIAAESGRKVDVLGHSQGALQPRWAVRWWSSARDVVDDVVTLAGPHHGTVVADAACAAPGGCPPAAWQMRQGSAFLQALNEGDETPGDVSYTSIATQTDELVQPVETTALEGGSNIVLQDLCPGRTVDHALIAADAPAYALVVDAFLSPGPADVSRFDPATCLQASFAPPTQSFQAGLAAFRQTSGFEPQSFAAVPAEPPLASYAQPAPAPGEPTTTTTTAAPPSPAGGVASTSTRPGGTLPATGSATSWAATIAAVLGVIGLEVRQVAKGSRRRPRR